MGTSKSQPSPKGRSDAGKAWTQNSDDFKKGVEPQDAFDKILKAYKAEYKERTVEVLVDNGVKIVENIVKNLKDNPREDVTDRIANFFIETRSALALEGNNSFLAEVALSCGAEAIVKDKKERIQTFQVGYLAKIVEYIVSRDLPKLFGSPGVVNSLSVEKLLEESKASLGREKKDGESLESFINTKLRKLGEL